MKYDIYSKYHKKIKMEKVVPKLFPLWKEDFKSDGISRVTGHTRAPSMKSFNLLTQREEIKSKPLPTEFKSMFEISCRAPECSYPFDLDSTESGGCYNCIYCFAIYTKSSLYSSWFDGNPWKSRFPTPESMKRELKNIFGVRDVLAKERDHNTKKWTGTIGSTKSLRKSVAQRIPLHWGNRSESFIPQEKRMGIAKICLEFFRDIDYPIIINTKSTMFLDPEYWSIISEMEQKSLAFQVSIIHTDDDVAKKLEPGAPSSTDRWNLIKELNDAGIMALPRLEPIMAFINGTEEHLERYAEKAAECGVTRILMDSYSYTTKSSQIKKVFLAEGFDFDRMFRATSEFQVLGTYLISQAAYFLKQHGIKTSTFDFSSIPYNDDPNCCCLGDFFKNWYKYNLYHATNELIDKKRMSFTEFDENHYGEELSPQLRTRVKQIWNQEITSPWCPIWCEGVYADGIDENGNIIYSFDEKRLGEEFDNLVAMFGDK